MKSYTTAPAAIPRRDRERAAVASSPMEIDRRLMHRAGRPVLPWKSIRVEAQGNSMDRITSRPALLPRIVVPAIVCCAAVPAARADVVVENALTIDGAAGFSLLAMGGNSTHSVASDKSRTDSNLQFKSKLMSHFAGKSGNSSEIVRLDKGVVYELQNADRKYTEMTIEQKRAAMQHAMQQMDQAASQQASTSQQQLPVDASECQMSPPVVDARKTGEHATIAGLDTERATISLKQTCTDPKTLKACDLVFSIDNWLAPAAPGEEESRAFALNYAKQLGFGEEEMKAMQNRMQQAFSQYKDSWSQVMAKASEFQGYPLKTVLQISMGGPQCTNESGTQVASDPMFADAVDAGVQAGAGTATGAAASAVGQAAGQAVGNNVGGAVAGSAVGAFAGKLGSSLLAKLHKKDKPPEPAEVRPAASTEAAAPSGMIRLFRLINETTAIRGGPIPATTFEVPEGYTKVAAR